MCTVTIRALALTSSRWTPWTRTTTGARFHQLGILPGPGRSGRRPLEATVQSAQGWVDPDQFEQLRGTRSLPFRAGEHRRIAVKVIDFRGDGAIRILDLP